MIGNLDDATQALNDWSHGEYARLLSDVGSTRYVYLINGVVYKVESEPDWTPDINALEYLNYQRLLASDLPRRVRLPEMSLHNVDGTLVIASELVCGTETGECSDRWAGFDCSCNEGECMDPVLIEELSYLGWTDNIIGNAILSTADGFIYLIDLVQ